MNTRRILSGVSILGMLLVIALPSGAADAPAAAAPAEVQLVEIIVTAERRLTNLQETPVTVSVVNSMSLADIGGTSIQDLNFIVPGLEMQAQGSYTLPAIRGVSTTLTTLGNQPNIAIYIDGAYYPVSFGNFMNFADIDHIEVLKGPQGTLFGQNATGGAINIITKDPTSAANGYIQAGGGNYGETDFNLFANGALSSTLNGNISAYSHKDHGWADNIFLNRPDGATDGYGVRGKLQLKPSENATYTLEFDYSVENNEPANFMIGGDSAFAGVPGVVVASQLGQTSTPFEVMNPIYQKGGTFTAELNFDSFDLISITSGRFAHADGHFDIDNTNLNAVTLYYGPESSSGSEDFRLQSKSHQQLTWVVGLNAFIDTDVYNPFDVIAGGHSLPQYGQAKTDVYALYGQITDQFTNQFSGTLGARLTSDHVGVIDGSAAEGVPYTSLSHTWSDFSPKLTLNYEFQPKTMGYLTVSKGFKGGAYNSGAFQSAPIDPETLWDYELGVKADVTNHFRVDVSAFWYDYTNIQVQAFGASAVVAEDNNAAKARMIGADGDLTWTYGGVFTTQDSLNVTAGFAALHSDYGEYHGASLATEQFVGCPNACTKISAGDVITSVDASGNTLVDAPNFTVNLSVNYAWQTAIGRFGLTPAAYYNSGYFLDAANSARFKQGAFTKLNATANWESTDKHYTLQLWGKNLTSAKQLGGVLVSALGPAANGYAPATYGIRGAYHW